MELTPKLKKILIIFISVGIFSSLYLTYDHYSNTSSACDFSATISCSLVNSSIYSDIIHIPAALLGLLWFSFTLIMMKKITTHKKYLGSFLVWNTLGLISIFYFLWAEIKLNALCPVCTIVHVLIIILFIISLFLYLPHRPEIGLSASILQIKWWLIGGLIIILLLSYLFQGQQAQQERTSLAQCLTQNGVRMYGSYTCSHCLREKQLFGDAFKFINYIECHPQGPNPQTPLCETKQISNTPTWTIELNDTEVKRVVGYLDAEQLKTFGSC